MGRLLLRRAAVRGDGPDEGLLRLAEQFDAAGGARVQPFVEIPALHQTGVFTREAVDAVLRRRRATTARRRSSRRTAPSVLRQLDVPFADLWWWPDARACGSATVAFGNQERRSGDNVASMACGC